MEEKQLHTESATINYTESGNPSGAPVLLMHGWGCNNTTLASVRAIMEALGLHVFNIDFPGFGKSPEPDEVWGVERYTQAVEEFLDALAIENPVVLGHSFGGRVGILLSSRRNVRKLLLVDAAGIRPRHSLKWYFKVYSFKAMKRIAPIIYGRQGAERRIEQARARKGSSDYASASPRMRAILSRCVNEDLRDRLPLIKAPTLLIWGENDTATPLRDAKLMERLIPDAGLVAFPGCGHYSFLDNPFGFKAVVNEFLKDTK